MSALPWALVPAKAFARSKARLASVLSETDREALARGFLTHVLDVLGACDAIGGRVVVTDSDEVAEVARSQGAIALRDEASSLAGIIDAALRRVEEMGASGAIVFMSDLPELAPIDVRTLAGFLGDRDVVAVPDLRGEGTNAIAIASPRRFPTCFGHADSFARHLARARELGLRVGVHTSERLGFDVDDPSDLVSLRKRNRVSRVSAA